ncbi:SRPBCC family protein [Nocardia sp. NPDC051570]|uniref:SRPBCC family protein n=1 Tax=Nocardia sp. NPDC051570 TaxID=3364324 RepID=UPI00379FF325
MTHPDRTDADAAILIKLSTRIAAPIERVWAVHTDIDAWASWRTDITESHMDQPVEPGSSFHWSTPRLAIDSTIYSVDAPHRILWGGSGHGITGIHLWTFETDGDHTVVYSEMSWDGEPVRSDLENQRNGLTHSLSSWLDKLRETAESAS